MKIRIGTLPTSIQAKPELDILSEHKLSMLRARMFVYDQRTYVQGLGYWHCVLKINFNNLDPIGSPHQTINARRLTNLTATRILHKSWYVVYVLQLCSLLGCPCKISPCPDLPFAAGIQALWQKVASPAVTGRWHARNSHLNSAVTARSISTQIDVLVHQTIHSNVITPYLFLNNDFVSIEKKNWTTSTLQMFTNKGKTGPLLT